MKGLHICAVSLFIAVIAVVLSVAAVSAGEKSTAYGEQGQIERLNTVLEQAFRDIPQSDVRVDAALVSRVREAGRLPVIVRLRDHNLPYGLFSNKQSPRAGIIAGLQTTVLSAVEARTAADDGRLHVKRFRMLPAMALQVDAEELAALIDHPNVIDVVEDVPMRPTLQDSVPLIGADLLDGSFSGYTGQGQAVAILDTGVDKNHPFLAGKVVSEACYSSTVAAQNATSLCPCDCPEETSVDSAINCNIEIEGCDHGTHVAGIAAGRNETFSGVARDADIIAIQVFSLIDESEGPPDLCDGSSLCVRSYVSDQIKALERVYELRDTHAIAAVNMSLGGGRYYVPCNEEAQKPIIETLRTAGIATVIASGNDGYVDSLASPACIECAVSVGSTTKGDDVSGFSNSAYFLSLLAPGQAINSSVPVTPYVPAPVLYDEMNGTSMAAPHVAGAWAVIKEAVPDASVPAVLRSLQSSGFLVTDIRPGSGNRIRPRIDVAAAIAAITGCTSDIDCAEGLVCDVANSVCVECLEDVHCAGSLVCDAANAVCVECLDDTHCSGSLVCDVANLVCVECLGDPDCDDGVVCNGDESCSGGICQPGTTICSGDTPFCDEAVDQCVECLWDSQCGDGFRCVDNLCVTSCLLSIQYKPIYSARLTKPRRVNFRAIGPPGIPINFGPDIEILRTRPNLKRGFVRIRARVPAGLPPQVIMVRVGDCFGQIEIQ